MESKQTYCILHVWYTNSDGFDLPYIDSSEIGLWFEQSSWSPFQYIGITLAVLHTWGKIPVLNNKCIIHESGTESSFWNCFKSKVVALLGPTALLFAVLLIISCISFSFSGSRDMEFNFSFYKESVIFHFDFGIFLSILHVIFARFHWSL